MFTRVIKLAMWSDNEDLIGMDLDLIVLSNN